MKINTDYIYDRIEKISELHYHLCNRSNYPIDLCQGSDPGEMVTIKHYEEFIENCINFMEDVASQDFHQNDSDYKSQLRRSKYLLKKIKANKGVA